MALYKILKQQNADFDPEEIAKMKLLHDGGYEILNHAELFLPKLNIESRDSYNQRLRCAAYFPYVSQFTNQFSSHLFSDDLTIHETADANDPTTLGGTAIGEFYKIFQTNCDGEGTSFHNFMRDTFEEASALPYAYIGADFNKVDDLPLNLLEEEVNGNDRAYIYDIDPNTVIDWKINPANEKFEWVKIENDCLIHDNPLALPMHQIEYKIWRMENGIAIWELYQSKILDLNKFPASNTDIPKVDEGKTSFREIPVWRFLIPKPLHIGFKIGPLNEELFNRRSFLVSNMNKTCISIPVVMLGPEISPPDLPLPSEKQRDPHRAEYLRNDLINQGYTVIGAGDDLKIVEATGNSHALVDKQLIDLIERMHELIAQMANSSSNNKKALGRSAASKEQDRVSTEVLLSAYSKLCKEFIKEVLTAISTARKEDIIWDIQGLSTFIEEDRYILNQEMLAVAGKAPLLSVFPSPTLHKKLLFKLGMSAVGTLSEEEERSIKKELEDAIDQGLHMQAFGTMDEQGNPLPSQNSRTVNNENASKNEQNAHSGTNSE